MGNIRIKHAAILKTNIFQRNSAEGDVKKVEGICFDPYFRTIQ